VACIGKDRACRPQENSPTEQRQRRKSATTQLREGRCRINASASPPFSHWRTAAMSHTIDNNYEPGDWNKALHSAILCTTSLQNGLIWQHITFQPANPGGKYHHHEPSIAPFNGTCPRIKSDSLGQPYLLAFSLGSRCWSRRLVKQPPSQQSLWKLFTWSMLGVHAVGPASILR
jgi:hypothetical protein